MICSILLLSALTVGTDFRFAPEPWQPGKSRWPSRNFRVPETMRDWSAYDRLVMDIVHSGGEDECLYTYICRPSGRVQVGLHAETSLPAEGRIRWTIPLSGWPAEMDSRDVGRIHLYSVEPEDLKATIVRMVLLKAGEELPPLAADAPRPGPTARAHAEAMRAFRSACRAAGSANAAFALGQATPMEKVMPRATTVSPCPATNLQVRVARNEHEAIQLLILPSGGDLEDVKVSATADGLPAESIRVSPVGYVEVKRGGPYRVGYAPHRSHRAKRGWYPEPLLDFLGSVEIRGDDLQSFWIDICAGESAPAGNHRGTITVSAKGVRPMKLPFAVRVNDFAIPRRPPLPTAITFDPIPSSEGATEEFREEIRRLRELPEAPVNVWSRQAEAWWTMLADHFIIPDDLYHTGKKGNPRLAVLRRFADEGRLDCFNLGYFECPQDLTEKGRSLWNRRNLQRLRRTWEEVSAAGLGRYAYIYGCDEVTTDRFDRVAWAVGELKREFPGVPVFTTACDKRLGVGSVLSSVDWFTPKMSEWDPEKVAASRRSGHQAWWYVCCTPGFPYANMFIECPAIETRLLMGAMTAKYRPDGFLYYQMSLWNGRAAITKGPFTEWTARSWTTWNGDGCLACVGPDGSPLSTVRLENFRDGLEDFAYALILEDLIARAPRSDAAELGRRLLSVPPKLVRALDDFSYDPRLLARWRDAMADVIERMGADRPIGQGKL